MKNYLPACVVAALLSGCASMYAVMPNGKPFDGHDPITGAQAAFGDIEKCYEKGGVKERSYHGGWMGPPLQPAKCVN